MPKEADPLNVNARLYAQIARLLDQLEDGDNRSEITIPQRINALIAVGRIQIMFANLKKALANDPIDAGSAVRRYAAAFAKPHAARGGKAHVRLASVTDDDDGSDDSGFDPESDPAA